MRVVLFAGFTAGFTIAFLSGMPAALAAQPTSADDLNAQSAPAPATSTAVLGSDPDMPVTVVTHYPGNAGAVPPTAMNKSYPVCTATRQDNCQNRGEGGARGRSRALGYWPGRPTP